MNTTYPTFHLKKVYPFCQVEYYKEILFNGQNNLNVYTAHTTHLKSLWKKYLLVATEQCVQICLRSQLNYFKVKIFWNRLHVFCKFSHSAQSVFLAKKILSKNYEDYLLNLLTYQEKIALSLKVSKFHNEFMKSSFLPKYEPKILRMPCIVAQYRTEILTTLGSYFGRNNDFLNSFWNLLTFKDASELNLLNFVKYF